MMGFEIDPREVVIAALTHEWMRRLPAIDRKLGLLGVNQAFYEKYNSQPSTLEEARDCICRRGEQTYGICKIDKHPLVLQAYDELPENEHPGGSKEVVRMFFERIVDVFLTRGDEVKAAMYQALDEIDGLPDD